MEFSSRNNDKSASDAADESVDSCPVNTVPVSDDITSRLVCDSDSEHGHSMTEIRTAVASSHSTAVKQVECFTSTRLYQQLTQAAPCGPATNTGWRRWFQQGDSSTPYTGRLCGGGGGGVVSADTSGAAAAASSASFSSISQAGGWSSPTKPPPPPPPPPSLPSSSTSSSAVGVGDGCSAPLPDNPAPVMNGVVSESSCVGSSVFPAASNTADSSVAGSNCVMGGGSGAGEEGSRSTTREAITNGVVPHQDGAVDTAAAASSAATLPPPVVAADNVELEVARLMQQAITATEGWGAGQVNQDTGWQVPPSPEPLPPAGPLGAAAGAMDPSMAAAMMGRMTGVLAQWKQPGVSNGTEVWHANLRNGGVPVPRPADPQWTPHVPQKNVGGTWGEDDDAVSNDNMWAGPGQRSLHGMGAPALHRPPSVMSGSGSAWPPSMMAKQGDMSLQQQQSTPSASASTMGVGGMMLPHHHPHHPHHQQQQPPPILPSVQQPPPPHPHSHMLPHSQLSMHGMHQIGNKPTPDHLHRPSLDSWGGVRSGSAMSGAWPPGAAGSGSAGLMSVGAAGGANCWPPPTVDDRLQQNVPLNYDDWNKRQGVMSRGPTNHMVPGSGGASSRLSSVSGGSSGTDGWPRTAGPGALSRGWPSGGEDSKLRASGNWPPDIGNDTDWSKMGRSMPHKNHLSDRTNLRGVQQESIEMLMRSNPMMSIDEAMEQIRASSTDQHGFNQQLHQPLHHQQQQQLSGHHPLHQGQAQYSMDGPQRHFTGPSAASGAAFSQMPPPPPSGPSQMGVGSASMGQDVFRQQQQHQQHQSRAHSSTSYRFGGQMQQQQQPPQQQPMAQQLRPLIGQIQAAVQSGHLNPAVLQQPLAPPTLHLLNQLLAQVKLLDDLTRRQQHALRPGQPNPNQLQQLHMEIMRVKSNMSHIQNEISVQQSTLMKQQQQQQTMGSSGRNVLPSARNDPLTGHQDLHHQQQQHQQQQQQSGLGSLNFADMSIRDQPRLPVSTTSAASSCQKSKLLSQWVLPSTGGGSDAAGETNTLDKDLDFVRVTSGSVCSDLSSSLTNSLLPVSTSDWSITSASSSTATTITGGAGGAGDSWATSGSGASGRQLNGSVVATNSLADLVPEFEPGKPWKGPQVRTADDDPTLTPGSLSAGISELLMITSASAVSATANSVTTQGGTNSPLTAAGDGWAYSSKSSAANNYKWSGSGGAGDWSNAAPLSAIGASRHTGAWSTGQAPQQGWALNSGGAQTGADHTWILLRNISTQIDSGTLSTLCMQHGPLVAFHMMSARGLALARYSSSDQANRAQCALNQCTLAGSTIVCSTLSDEQAVSVTQQPQQQQSLSAGSSLFSGVKAPSAAAWADVADSSLGGASTLGWSSGGGGSSLLWGSGSAAGAGDTSSSVLDDVHQMSAASVSSSASIGAIGAPAGCMMRSISAVFDSPQSVADTSRP